MPESRIEFKYTSREVTSAQRLRLLKSGQFKGIILFWAASILFLAVHILFPQTFQIVRDSSWALIGEVTLIYIVTMLVLMYVTPWMDFAINKFWRLSLALAFNESQLRLTLAKPPKKTKGSKASSGLVLKWDEIRRVMENQLVYVIIYGPQSKFFVVPKSAFTKPGVEERFRALVGQSGLGLETAAKKA